MEDNIIKAVSIIAVGILLAGAALASGLGVSQVAGKFLEGAARNPTQTPTLQVKAFVMIGTLDALPFIAVAVAMLLLFANPFLV